MTQNREVNAKIQLLLGILVLSLVLGVAYYALEALITLMGWDKDVAHLLAGTTSTVIAGAGMYFGLRPIAARAYPRAFAKPETKIAISTYCLLVAVNPLLEFGLKQVGLDKTLWAFFLSPYLITFVVACIYAFWWANKNRYKLVIPAEGEKMTAEQEKREKQQEAGNRWLESLAESRQKHNPYRPGAGFLLIVLLMISQLLIGRVGDGIHWSSILLYAGIFLVNVLVLVGLLALQEKLPGPARAPFFYGLGLGMWLVVLWLTQSSQLLWQMGIVLAVSVGFELWEWVRRRRKLSPDASKTADV